MNFWKKIIFYTSILLFVGISSIFLIGYQKYRLLIGDTPLDDVIHEIRSDENYIALEEVSPDFINALLAVEDPDFYDHPGVKISNIIEAFITNIKEHEYVMGGSTITQQLSKNMYFDQTKTFERKVAELFFVHDLESQLTKDEILELYINMIYFGDGYYGIQEACAGYFNKAPKDLTMAQATMLAGLPQAPAIYQLSDGMDLAKQRQKDVLQAMLEEELIDEEMYHFIYNQSLS